MTKDIHALYVSLSRYDHAVHNPGIVRASNRIPPYYNTVFLVLPSWQDWPDAFTTKLVRRFIDSVQRQGLKLYVGRLLWISRDDHALKSSGYVSSVGDPFHYNYYIEAAARVAEVAAMLGASGTVMDVEPVGPLSALSSHRLMVRPKGNVLREDVFQMIRRACPRGKTDWVLPCWSSKEFYYPNAFSQFGLMRCDETTYYAKDAEAVSKVKRPRFELVGHSVGLSKGRWLMPEQVLNFDLAKVRETHSECLGDWCYMGAATQARTILSRRWYPKAARGRVTTRRTSGRRTKTTR